MSRLVVASEDAYTTHPGSGLSTRVRKGTVWPADHPIVRAMPSLFAPLPDVEQATQAPGERRGGRRG